MKKKLLMDAVIHQKTFIANPFFPPRYEGIASA